MQLLQNIDPRDPLERATRDDMWSYVERHGIKEITWDMPGSQMRYILRKLGIKDLGLPHYLLGSRQVIPTRSLVDGPINSTSVMVEDLERMQWEQQRQDTVRPETVSTNDTKTRAQLAKECKRLGIKMARTDTKEKLIERLNGKSHAA